MSKGKVTYWIRRIHTYLGLLNFSILVVFGLAGLIVTLEAPDIFSQKEGPATVLRDFTAPASAADADVAAEFARTLNLSGIGRPGVRRNEANQLVADFYSVNGLVRVTLLSGERQIRIQTFRNSIWRFIDNAHATTIAEETASRTVHAWAWYIEFSIWSLMAMALSGVWLGLASRWDYRWTRPAFALGCLVFAVLFWMER